MAKYQENLIKNKDLFAKKITGIPEMAKKMVERNLITEDEKFQIMSYNTQGRAQKLLETVGSKYRLKKFIKILKECRHDECAKLIQGDAELSDDEEEEEPNNEKLVSDLQVSNKSIKELQDANSRLEREVTVLRSKIRELNISLDNVQRMDEHSSRVIRQELDETKNKLTIAEEKLSELKSKNFVIENTQLHDELSKTNDKVQSLTKTTEEMQIQNKRMEEKIDVIVASLGLPSNSVPKTNRSGEITIPNSDRESVPLTGRSSNTRIGSAQVAKLPPINKSK
ncbi:uncharacterized protein LOC134683548 [Mytilus trossulus]|uniref:uncharacterized protein LOC134683548 n=1 Tax=Mytilus trossulus TaxID=6551 RepID=UPI003004CD28